MQLSFRVINYQLCHEDKILIDFGIYNSVPKVLDQTYFIVERNFFIRVACGTGMYSVTRFLHFFIFVVPCIMLYSGEMSPTRCNNCVFYSQWLYSACFG